MRRMRVRRVRTEMMMRMVREPRYGRKVRIPVLGPKKMISTDSMMIQFGTHQPVLLDERTSARVKRKEYALVTRRHRVPNVHIPVLPPRRRR
jgi:hypothetical protein